MTGGLVFPCDYPLKVVGRRDGDWRARVHAIVLRHVPQLEAARISERDSARGSFLSLSFNIPAHSREQIERLVAELKACEGVLFLL